MTSGVSELQKADAKLLPPPAAHRATRALSEIEPLIQEMERIRSDLDTCLELSPHDKSQILRMMEALKARAQNIFGQTINACQDIRSGR